MRRLKYPQTAADWHAALSAEPTYEHTDYLKHGSLKKGEPYARVCNLITEYVIKHFNATLATFKCEKQDVTQTVFQLVSLRSALERLNFYRSLEFLKAKDKRNIEQAVSAAVNELTVNFNKSVGCENADIAFELNALKQLTGNGEL